MNPTRTNAEHKLGFMRQSPRLLKQKVSIPFCRVTTRKPRHASLEFQPVLFRRNFNRDSGPGARSAAFEAPATSSPKLNDCGRFFINGLREGASKAEKQGRYQHGFCRVHCHLDRFHMIGPVCTFYPVQSNLLRTACCIISRLGLPRTCFLHRPLCSAISRHLVVIGVQSL